MRVPLLDPMDPDSGKRIQVDLPFLDPHEYLEYLWSTDRIHVSDEEIKLPAGWHLLNFYNIPQAFGCRILNGIGS